MTAQPEPAAPRVSGNCQRQFHRGCTGCTGCACHERRAPAGLRALYEAAKTSAAVARGEAGTAAEPDHEREASG